MQQENMVTAITESQSVPPDSLEDISADLRDEAKQNGFGREELEDAIKSVRVGQKPGNE